jgi:hypothetical protein
MTLVSEDIAAARRAVSDLERRAASLTRHYGDTVDARRLLADVGRLAADLELLCGAVAKPRPAAPSPPPSVPSRQVIPDSSYTDGFWMDAEDEGLGRTR